MKLYADPLVLTILISSFLQCVTLSVDPEKDAKEWFNLTYPAKHDEGDTQMAAVYANLTLIFIYLATILRPVMMLSRWGVGLKLFLVAFLSYFDFVTDILVSRDLYENGEVEWAAATLSCVGFAIGVKHSSSAYSTASAAGRSSARRYFSR